jgi:hypothetical protein
VEIEQCADALIIKPKAHDAGKPHAEIVQDMKAAGLIEDLPWAQPLVVSAEERAWLAKKLGAGQPLSEIIVEERDARQYKSTSPFGTHSAASA